jgi:hypothetical protein
MLEKLYLFYVVENIGLCLWQIYHQHIKDKWFIYCNMSCSRTVCFVWQQS